MTNDSPTPDKKPTSPREIKKNGANMSPAYMSWSAMKTRCLNPNTADYKHYGGRGIKICDRWLGKDGFNNFYADMGERTRGLTLDRINSDGNYEPSNCRWADRRTQTLNRKLTSTSKTGHMGISKTRTGGYMAYVSSGSQMICLGTFTNIEDAIQARADGETKYYRDIDMTLEEIYKGCDVSNNGTVNPLSFDDFKAAILSLLPAHRLNSQPGYEQLPAMYSQGWNAAINKMLQNIAVKPDDTIHHNFTGQTDNDSDSGILEHGEGMDAWENP